MPAVNLSPVLRQRFFDTNGNPLAGGKVYSYQAGTSTPQATYTDSTGTSANTNPVILDASGEADIWLDQELSYKIVLDDANDVQQWETDGIVGILTPNAVNTAAIADGAVTTPKLADGAVTSAKIATNAIAQSNMQDNSVGTAELIANSVTLAKLAAEVAQALNPAGSVIAFAGFVPPAGYLLCDGAAYSRTTYATLFAAIGDVNGQGDGSTTFNVPDLRGKFLRGVSGTSGNDPDAAARSSISGGNAGNNVGSIQGDQFASHNHGGGAHTHSGAFLQTGAGSGGLVGGGPDGSTAMASSGTIISTQGGNETRVKNVYVEFYIKF